MRKLAAAALVDLGEVFRRHFVERPVDHHVLARGRLPHSRRARRRRLRGFEVEQRVWLALAEAIVGAVDGHEPLADGLPPAIFDATLEEPEDRGLRGFGVVESRSLPQRAAVVAEHSLDDALKQRMAGADELDLGVTLRLVLVEGDLRVRLADLAEPPFHRLGQLAEVGRNAADRPDALRRP